MITKKFNTFDDIVNYIENKPIVKFFLKEHRGDAYSMLYIIYKGEYNMLIEGITIVMEESNGGMLELTHE